MLSPRHADNLGRTAQRKRRRTPDPMAAFDALPPPLRHWLAQAVLPWSAASVRRLWRKAIAAGASPAEALMVLDRAETRALRREARDLRRAA
ncbi:DUF6525 family protein [Paracoccus sp. (in: a-proteobacteria)]|uniref:DUF6525 family protein n=1 Tax=Paracoccus sp. TaxID=267 RepID=UPI00396C84F7